MITIHQSPRNTQKPRLVTKGSIALQQCKSAATTASIETREGNCCVHERFDAACQRNSLDQVRSRCRGLTTPQVAYTTCRTLSLESTQPTPRSALKHVLRHNTFRNWAKSYHGSVRNSVGHELANVCYTKHRSEMTLKALACAVRSRRIQQAKLEADAFALDVVLRRWCAMAARAATERHNRASASIFYQTSLASRTLRAFKVCLQLQRSCKRAAHRLVELMEKCLVETVLAPLRQHARRQRSLDACAADIAHDRNVNTLKVAFDALHHVYRCRVASETLEPQCRRFLLQQAWKRIRSRHLEFVEKEARLEQGILREKASTAFDCWHTATKTKQASQYYAFMLKYKTFNAFRNNAEGRAGESTPSATSDPPESGLPMMDPHQGRITAALCHKRGVITAAGLVAKCLHIGYKRASLRALMDNAKRVARELLRQQSATDVHNKQLMKRALMAWGQYRESRRKKQSLYTSADLNYKCYLISHFFDALRESYLGKLQEFNAALRQFKSRQETLRKRLYLRAFAYAVERSRTLRVAQKSLEDLHESQSRLSVLQRLDAISANALVRKLNCVSRIAGLNLHLSHSDGPGLLSAFRDMSFHDRDEERGLFNALRDKALSPNVLMLLTLPLRSECVVFLHYLSGLKTHALGLMKTLGMRFNDAVVRVCQSLTAAEMAKLHSDYAYQLYTVRLEGLPSISAAHEPAGKLPPAASRELVSFQTEGEASFQTLTNRSDGLQLYIGNHPADDVSEAQGAARDGASHAVRVSDLSDIPDWAVALLQRLTLVKLLGISDSNKTLLSARCTAFDLSCSGLPLWRLVFTMLVKTRCVSLFRAWRNRTAEKRTRGAKLSEVQTSLAGLFSMSLRVECFAGWLRLARSSRERRLADLRERCDTFVAYLSLLAYRSVGVVFMRLRLKQVLATTTGADRRRHMRALLKAVATSCRECDASAEIAAFRMYTVVRKQFNEWRMHTHWHLEVTSQASAFYRTLFLRKGWDTLEGAFRERSENRRQLESSAREHLREWRLSHCFVAWNKTVRCRRALPSLILSKRTATLRCFRYWREYAHNAGVLSDCGVAIARNSNGALLRVTFEGMMGHVSKCRAVAALRSRFESERSRRLSTLAFTTWRDYAERRVSLSAAHSDIQQQRDRLEQNHLLSTMYGFTFLKRNSKRRVKDRMFVLMRISVAASKVSKTIERHWELSEERACREFFALQRVMAKAAPAYGRIIASGGELYAALRALATLDEARVATGLEALQRHVRYNQRIREVQQLHSARLVARLFGCWRRCAAYSARVAVPADTSREQLARPDPRVALNKAESVESLPPRDEVLTGDAMDRYCLLLTCFKHWRNMTVVLPGCDAGAMVEAFATQNRLLDGIYLLKVNALSVLWRRTCKTRLQILVDSANDRLKLSIFHEWRALARQNAASPHVAGQLVV
ncbi:flagellar hook protein FlgE [Babesia caballi]|uniref:Flagellar hook protein FlgE n=1 Tax=Babesia caballi TaxID=5871 RepID=A0AAV4M070_BABCB|nr:flagellar hook protein FlgE [Babesia caballi]